MECGGEENDEQEEGEEESYEQEGEDGQAGEDQREGGEEGLRAEEGGSGEPTQDATGQEDVEGNKDGPRVGDGNEMNEKEEMTDPKKKDEGKAAHRRRKEGKGADLIVEEPEGVKPSFQPDGMYYAVKQVLKGVVNGFPLNKRFKDESTPDPGFLQPGDERWGRNFNQFKKLSKARIVSCSFDSSTGTCRTCLSGEHAAWESADGGPIVVKKAKKYKKIDLNFASLFLFRFEAKIT
jgi:hypothetical protein